MNNYSENVLPSAPLNEPGSSYAPTQQKHLHGSHVNSAERWPQTHAEFVDFVNKYSRHPSIFDNMHYNQNILPSTQLSPPGSLSGSTQPAYPYGCYFYSPELNPGTFAENVTSTNSKNESNNLYSSWGPSYSSARDYLISLLPDPINNCPLQTENTTSTANSRQLSAPSPYYSIRVQLEDPSNGQVLQNIVIKPAEEPSNQISTEKKPADQQQTGPLPVATVASPKVLTTQQHRVAPAKKYSLCGLFLAQMVALGSLCFSIYIILSSLKI